MKRKPSSTKRLSPAPQLGPSDTHTYYSESVVRESYYGSPRAASLARSSILDDQLHSDAYWSEWNPSPGLCFRLPHPVPDPTGPAGGSQASAPRSLRMMEEPRGSSQPRGQKGWAQLTLLGRAKDRVHQGAPPSPGLPEYPPRHLCPGEPCLLPSAGEDLPVRRRRGTGDTESSKINGLVQAKLSEDFPGSSSGYSSEDDFVGRRHSAGFQDRRPGSLTA